TLVPERLQDRRGAVGEGERAGEDLHHGPAARDADRLNRRRVPHRGAVVAGGFGGPDASYGQARFHTQLLVRAFTDRTVHLVPAALECPGRRAGGGGLVRSGLLGHRVPPFLV